MVWNFSSAPSRPTAQRSTASGAKANLRKATTATRRSSVAAWCRAAICRRAVSTVADSTLYWVVEIWFFTSMRVVECPVPFVPQSWSNDAISYAFKVDVLPFATMNQVLQEAHSQ